MRFLGSNRIYLTGSSECLSMMDFPRNSLCVKASLRDRVLARCSSPHIRAGYLISWSVTCYADDTQPYVSFSSNQSTEADTAIKSMTDCIIDVRSWMISDNLMLIDGKTGFLILGTKQQLAKVNIEWWALLM